MTHVQNVVKLFGVSLILRILNYLIKQINRKYHTGKFIEMAGITRPLSQMRKMEAKETLFRTRKRILKYLVLAFLKQEGYHRTAEDLVSEANLTMEYEVCDNIDLDIILQDYCSYYLMRFNKQPQFCRKVDVDPAAQVVPKRSAHARKSKPDLIEKVKKEGEDLPATFSVRSLMMEGEHPSTMSLDRKPLSAFLKRASPEKRELAELLYQDIIRPSTLTWDDVKGLDSAKSLLMESVVYPIRYPEVFTGLLEPWRGVLLHGPPGTGKTMLARVVAAESNCTFFNISSGSVVTKWRGESEKLVKMLFEMAAYFSPSIIFIDEVETLTGERAGPGEHEASRRLKAQLLVELDGIARRDGLVFLLANSNMPWEIDLAMLRRLEKRIYIPLPDEETRAQLFQAYLRSKNIELDPKVQFEELARMCDGYSGSDIKLVCKEAMMVNVRKMLPGMAKGHHQHRKDRLCLADILSAIEKTRPVSKNLAWKHVEWQNDMGCS